MYSSDKPIQSIEADALGRTTFSRQLAHAILSYKETDNLTIGLCGKWGSGKTSIINMVVETIHEETSEILTDEQMIIVHFDPWNYSDRNQLIEQFFSVISSELQISSHSEKLKEAGKAIERYSDVFKWAAYIPVVGQYLTPITALVDGLGDQLQDAASKQEDLVKQKKAVVEALLEQPQKILVIIDDIDRLNNEQIRLIFQLVNSVAGFPNIIYLLSFDKSVVVRALENEQNCNGEEYLEKIIQVPFDIPDTSPEQVNSVFFERLTSILSEEDEVFDRQYWSDVFFGCIAPFLANLRDVNRICNVFKFKYDLMNGELNWIDLLAVTAIQVNAPALYDWIKNSLVDLTGSVREAGGQTGNESKGMRERYLQTFTEILPAQPETALHIIQTLFPKIAWKTSFLGSEESAEDLQHSKRIASDRYSRLYFSLDVDEIAVPKALFQATIFDYDAEKLHSFLQDMAEEEKLDYYYRELIVYVEEIPENRIELFFDELALWQEDKPIDRSGLLGLKNYRYDGYEICLRLLKRMGSNACLHKIVTGLENSGTNTIVLYSKIVDGIERAYGRIGNYPNDKNRLVNESQLSLLEEQMRLALQRNAELGDMFCLNRFEEIMPIWYYLDKDSLAAYEKRYAQFPGNVPYLLGRRSGTWQSARQYGPTFSEGKFEDVISLEALYEAVLSLKGTADYKALPDRLKDVTVGYYLWYSTQKELGEDHISQEQINECRREWDVV